VTLLRLLLWAGGRDTEAFYDTLQGIE